MLSVIPLSFLVTVIALVVVGIVVVAVDMVVVAVGVGVMVACVVIAVVCLAWFTVRKWKTNYHNTYVYSKYIYQCFFHDYLGFPSLATHTLLIITVTL